jgi:class 3 adenylate cyclase
MPTYIDLHNVPEGVTPKDLALAHLQDLEAQTKHGVRYLRYWFDLERHKVNCLVDAPSREAAIAVHSEAHGLLADEIIPVETGSVEDLLGQADEAPAWTPDSSGPPPAESPFRTILFTDMEGSTASAQRAGDDGHMEILRVHNAIIREALNSHGGREVKHTGDGIMASFGSSARAVESAVLMQRHFDEHNQPGHETPIRVRVGMGAGEPVEEGQDFFGAAVQLAARICGHPEPGQILVPNVVRELCIGKRLSFLDRGEASLKGFADPVRVFEVPWRESQ